MITKNGSILWGKGRLGGAEIVDSDMKTFQGYNMGSVVNDYRNSIVASATNPQYYSMAIGSGTSEPQKSDYSMQEITSQYVSKSNLTSVSYTPDGNVVFTRTFTNITNDNVTITELGIYLVVSSYVFLVARKLIPSRTIQPNETVTFSYVVEFN